MFVRKRIYVYKNEWFLYIDIENLIGKSSIKRSVLCDSINVNLLDISFDVKQKEIEQIYDRAIMEVEQFLKSNNVVFSRVDDKFSVEKVEDTYHPYAMALSNSNSLQDFVSKYENLLVVNTGILPRAGGINTTAALFPLIEYYIDEVLFNLKK
jgi:hypothetical protein